MGISHHPQVTILNGSDIRSLYNFSGEQVRTAPTHNPAWPSANQVPGVSQ